MICCHGSYIGLLLLLLLLTAASVLSICVVLLVHSCWYLVFTLCHSGLAPDHAVLMLQVGLECTELLGWCVLGHCVAAALENVAQVACSCHALSHHCCWAGGMAATGGQVP